MMLSKPTSPWRRLAWLAILPFLAGTMFLANPVRAKAVPFETMTVQTPDTTKAVSFTLIDPECKPTFNGSDANEFARWVNGNLVYPENAKNGSIQGRLVLQFTICTDGKVRDVKVLRGIDPDLDAEAIRVVSSSPDWKPGSVNGKPVNVSYVFPIVFKLRGDKKDGVPTTMTVDNAGGNASFQIRGQKDSVLVLLDGKEIPFSKMSEIDPNTVKSISVLKDKAALEQYGEKGRNGVILITSKEQ